VAQQAAEQAWLDLEDRLALVREMAAHALA
jgi:urea carboxylase